MDVEATEQAIQLLEKEVADANRFGPREWWAGTTGKAILESAAYHLRTGLRQYLTRRGK